MHVNRDRHAQWKRIHLKMVEDGSPMREYGKDKDTPSCYVNEYVYFFKKQAKQMGERLEKDNV